MGGGGQNNQDRGLTSHLEMLSAGAAAFVELPPLSCGVIYGAAAIAVNESDSALGQVLLLGGRGQDSRTTSSFSATGGSGHRRMHTAG
jgi:hypothetical protein